MKLVKIRLTGKDKEAIEVVRQDVIETFQVVDNGSIQASSRAKYSGSYICYMQVVVEGNLNDESN